nr:shieldin complex subunit 1 [Zootoca vivipara]XP_034966020.1 shieldin complex subunit 1 [Zootoca vivipara]XP_034966021.1 shieldin complex subunit 1 [Zootoca vivipara]
MEGSEAASSCQSGESSLLDIPCTISAESFLLNPRTGRSDEILRSAGTYVSPASTEVDTDPNNDVFIAHTVGTSVAWRPRQCEKAEPKNCVDGELPQPSQLPLSWTCEQTEEGGPSIRQSLDRFYGTCCQKKLFGGSPAYEAASQCLSVKIAELAGKEGMTYAQKSLQMAQMVLNRDENKVFPQRSSSTCFSIPTETRVSLEERKQMPGLSNDILQFILKQNITK